VFNASNNQFNGSLPWNWSSMAELRLDNNDLTGKLPAAWSNWGSNTSNAIQLSLVDTQLRGHMPRQWVQQFCLATVQNFSERVLFTPSPYDYRLDDGEGYEGGSLIFNDIVQTGSPIVVVGQHASINVSLGGKSYSFSYSDPDAICSIPNAVRNTALLWGIFAALLVGTIIGVQVWLRRKQKNSPWLLTTISATIKNSKFRLPKRVLAILWFLVSDVAWYIYSQVSDVATIHQVFRSGQLQYAYPLLALLLLPFILVWSLVAVLCTRLSWSKLFGGGTHSTCKTWLCAPAAIFAGVMLSPLFFVALETSLILKGVGLSLPCWCLPASLDLATSYRLKSVGESLVNALPQAILQTNLYIMGNNPNGTHVYIDTTLYLFSVIGSLLSVLNTIGIAMIEVNEFKCGVIMYIKTLLRLESFAQYYTVLQGSSIP